MSEQRLIPIIPEYMDKWLKSKPLFLLLEDILIKDDAPTEIEEWFENTKNWTLGIGTLDEFIARLKLDGYTVEKPKYYKTTFSDYDFGIAETDEGIKAFHDRFWGSRDVKMKREALQALLDGKAILFEDGEYSNSIILEDSSLLEGN